MLHTWVTRGILASEKRAAHFRALGRGWIFLQLSSQSGTKGSHWHGSHITTKKITRFKWWFEGTERILRNRQDEFPAMRIGPEEVARWTSGYVHGAELVFALRGIIATVTLMARVKLRADYHREHVWAATDDIQRAVEAPMLTEDERQAMTKKAEALAAKKRAKRERQKAKSRQAAASGEGTSEAAAAKEKADGERARSAFEDMLNEFKEEEAAGEHAEDA